MFIAFSVQSCWQVHSGLLWDLSRPLLALPMLEHRSLVPGPPSVTTQLAYLGGSLESLSWSWVGCSQGLVPCPGWIVLFYPVHEGNWWYQQGHLYLDDSACAFDVVTSWWLTGNIICIELPSVAISSCAEWSATSSEEDSRKNWDATHNYEGRCYHDILANVMLLISDTRNGLVNVDQITWVYFQKVVRTNEIARSLIIS